jgi:hypothetical protein
LTALEVVYPVAVRIGLRDLRKVQKPDQTSQHDQNNRVAYRTHGFSLLAEGRGVLTTRSVSLAARRQ